MPNICRTSYRVCTWSSQTHGGTKDENYTAAKRILRYIKGSMNYGLLYISSDDSRLVGYIDSDSMEIQTRDKAHVVIRLKLAMEHSHGHKTTNQLWCSSYKTEHITTASCICQEI